ncbi:MAG: hypothetical protein MR687_00645 [Spirochaetales bacterium]|nr:hypothetical protein [Spirochaetales bacterium]
MKKILSIALIAALIVGSAFAGFKKGEATIDLGYNLDSQAYGFANGTAVKYNFGFVLGEETAEKAGEGDLRAEIAASFKAEFKAADYEGTATIADAVVSTLKITKANIIYKDVTVGILGAGKSATYAADYHLDNTTGKPVRDEVVGLDGVKGFTVSAFGYNGGFGLEGDADAETYAVLAHVQTKSFDLAEGVTAQAAAGMKVTDASKAFGVSAKAALSKDLLSASIAADFAVAEKVALEVAAKAAYDFVSADVYFFSVDGFETNVLDAKLAASKAVSETVTVGGSVEVINAIADARELKVGANVKAVVAPVTVEAKADYAVFGKTVGTTTKVTYAAEKFSAYAKLEANMKFADEFAMTKIAPEVVVSSDAIVSGATLSLGWTGADFAETANKKGAIKATAKISL